MRARRTAARDRREIEAESVAYVVTAATGLDASGYTFAYVAGWAGGNGLFGFERGHVVLVWKRRVRVPLAARSMRRR